MRQNKNSYGNKVLKQLHGKVYAINYLKETAEQIENFLLCDDESQKGSSIGVVVVGSVLAGVVISRPSSCFSQIQPF